MLLRRIVYQGDLSAALRLVITRGELIYLDSIHEIKRALPSARVRVHRRTIGGLRMYGNQRLKRSPIPEIREGHRLHRT